MAPVGNPAINVITTFTASHGRKHYRNLEAVRRKSCQDIFHCLFGYLGDLFGGKFCSIPV
jgi:hypothetical protein